MSIRISKQMLHRLLRDGEVPLDGEHIILTDGAGRSLTIKVSTGKLTIERVTEEELEDDDEFLQGRP